MSLLQEKQDQKRVLELMLKLEHQPPPLLL